jgi:hypothetical protein
MNAGQSLIAERKGVWLFALKANHPAMHQAVAAFFPTRGARPIRSCHHRR